MKVPSFKKFLEEEDSKAIVQTGLNSKSIDNSVTKEIINSRLANATSNPFLTPYIALGSIARILAYVNIVVPQYTFLDRDEGEVIFDATQVGQIAGVNLDGSPARSEADHFIYFSYSMNDEGYYDCFAALVDSDELEDIMDMGGDEDVDQFDVDQKVNEEQIDEISDDLKRRYLAGAKKYFRARERNDPYGNITDKDINRTRGVQRATDTMKSPEPPPVKKAKKVLPTPVKPTSVKPTQLNNEELKGDQHEIDANKNGRIDADDFKKLRGEEVDEGFDKWRNKKRKRDYLRQLGHKDSPVDFTSPGNTAAMAVRAGRDKLKKEETEHVDESGGALSSDGMRRIKKGESPFRPKSTARKIDNWVTTKIRSLFGMKPKKFAEESVKEEPTNPATELRTRIAAHQAAIAAHKAAKPQSVRKPAATPAPKPAPKSEPSVYDAAKNLPSNPAAQSYKKEIAARQAGKKVDEESINERKSSDPKGLAYKVTAASHAANPQWGPADHTQDPKTHFGTAATRSSTLAAVRSIRAQRSQGGFDANNPKHVDAAAKAVHGSPQDYEGKPKGWSQTAMTHSGQSPEQKERRAKLTGPYGSLSEPEKEKDREIVRTVAANMPTKKK